MTQTLDRLVAAAPPIVDIDDLWKQAMQEARRAGPVRRGGGESTEKRMQRLRNMLKAELVAFHDGLVVSPHAGDQQPTMAASRLWDVTIPLTLFPKRDQGFSRLECIVEFNTADETGLRVLKGLPGARDEIMARASVEGQLNIAANARLGIPGPALEDLATANVAGALYASAEIPKLVYEARRKCVETEIVRGKGCRWRLDDLRHPERVGVESHGLQVVLEVAEQAHPVHGAGYLNAYSDTRWLTASIGSVWRDFRGMLGRFFQRGLPAEAYAEWDDIIPVHGHP